MAAMTMTGGGFTLSFLAAQGQDGIFLFKLPMVVEEVLETEGVNGRRWRTKFEQMEPIAIDTISEASTFALAVSLAQSHRDLVGSLVAISWAAGGSTYTFKDAHITRAVARPIAGTVVGGGATGSATCHIRTSWIIEPTDFHVFVN